jgi:hypothetical protein
MPASYRRLIARLGYPTVQPGGRGRVVGVVVLRQILFSSSLAKVQRTRTSCPQSRIRTRTVHPGDQSSLIGQLRQQAKAVCLLDVHELEIFPPKCLGGHTRCRSAHSATMKERRFDIRHTMDANCMTRNRDLATQVHSSRLGLPPEVKQPPARSRPGLHQVILRHTRPVYSAHCRV